MKHIHTTVSTTTQPIVYFYSVVKSHVLYLQPNLDLCIII